MQSTHKAASITAPRHQKDDVSQPVRAFIPYAGRAAPFTNTPTALELHDRIEVWVNEGGAGGEAW